MTLYHDDYCLTDEQEQFDVSAVCALIKTAYWASHRSNEQVAESLKASTCLTLTCKGRTIGFVRALTDQTVNSYICDFVIAEDFRSQGLGTWMLEVLMTHPTLVRTQQLLLTRDAMDFYSQHGFAQHPYTCMKKPAPNPVLI